MIRIEKFDPARVYTTVYIEHETKQYYVKRFVAEPTEKKVEFVESPDQMIYLSGDAFPRLEIIYDMKIKTKGVEQEEINVAEFIGVKGVKAKGKRLAVHAVKKVNLLAPLAEPEESVVSGEPLVEADDPQDELQVTETPEAEPIPFRMKPVTSRADEDETVDAATSGGTLSELQAEVPFADIPEIKPSIRPADLLTGDAEEGSVAEKKPARKKRTTPPQESDREEGEGGPAGQMQLPF
jgi:hypothetical protein